MNRRMLAALLFPIVLIPTALNAQSLSQRADRFFDDVYFKFNPTIGTASGFHQYDALLEDYSRANIDLRTKVFHQAERQFAALPTAPDRDILLGYIRATLLDLEQIRSWEKNPDIYSSGVTNSIFVVMSRDFAPATDRLKSVIARERQIPAVFDAARANLKYPPRIYTSIAIEQIPGIISFFQSDVPLAFKSVTDQKILADFQKSNDAVIDSLKRYQAFLQNDLSARSTGDFRLGADLYKKKLLYEEMVDLPLDKLLAIGMADLRKNQKAFKETAAKINPHQTAQQILEGAIADHPAPDHLLQAFRDVLSGLKDYIVAKKIITIPSPVLPILEETPPFARALTMASMDTPGPYEKVAKEAFFNVTLPEKTWSAKQVGEHMEGFNRGTISSTAIHEAYPGHYVQFQWMQTIPSKVRKLLGANTNVEGWAHYCEQMMLDEGYGNNDLKLRLGQLQDALLRDARYVVGIQMHTGTMTYNQGVDFFVKEGYQTRTNGERETKRGTSDPTYLYYTLGKLEILKLREDYKKMKGGAFNLQEFHDNFMRQGYPPIKIVRQALIGHGDILQSTDSKRSLKARTSARNSAKSASRIEMRSVEGLSGSPTSATTDPDSRCAYRDSFCPGARSNFTASPCSIRFWILRSTPAKSSNRCIRSDLPPSSPSVCWPRSIKVHISANSRRPMFSVSEKRCAYFSTRPPLLITVANRWFFSSSMAWFTVFSSYVTTGCRFDF